MIRRLLSLLSTAALLAGTAAVADASAGAPLARPLPANGSNSRAPAPNRPATAGADHRYFGTLQTIAGNALTVMLRNGTIVRVDASDAFRRLRVSQPLFRGKPTVVVGTLGADGVLHATAVLRAAPLAVNWGADR